MCRWKQPCLREEESWRRMATWLSSATKWPQVQCHGVGVLVFSRCGNVMPSWREYKFRKIYYYWHLRYKFLAPVHRPCITQEYIAKNRIKNMSWHAQSPDIKIIQSIWIFIKRKLQSRINNINSADELFQHTLQIWQDINFNYVRNLYNSIPRNIQPVIRLNGHSTKYWGKLFISRSLQVFQLSRRIFLYELSLLNKTVAPFFLNPFVPTQYLRETRAGFGLKIRSESGRF